MPSWDPIQYGKFADQRSRPFFELTGRIAATEPRTVVDLGCGSGELTATLAQRWPTAHVTGIDSSPDMVAAAAGYAIVGRLEFAHADISTWRPPQAVDVIVSNAALQWVDGHLRLLPSLLETVSPGCWLAFQVPGNFTAPSHRLLAELRRSPRWAAKLGSGSTRAGSAEPAEYLRALAPLSRTIDVWETTYLQVLSGTDPVLEWVRGTALRPVLDLLDEREAAEFTGQYAAALREAYPRQRFGTVFEFRRIFVVARKP